MPELRLLLRDRNTAMADAWRQHFQGLERVDISCGDIFDVEADVIISPANSFGFMDGGIDLVYTRRFGWDLSKRLQELLRRDHAGELPVGQAVTIETGDPKIPWMISAPTMRVPMDVSETPNAYLAFRAALRAFIEHQDRNHAVRTLLCPGLGTAVGRMPADRCARQMAAAYQAVVLGQPWQFRSLGDAVDAHFTLIR